jgi:tyrosinase
MRTTLPYLALALLGACASVPTRPAETLPLVEVEINHTASQVDDYITWSPTPARIRISNSGSVTGTYPVVLHNMDPANGGQLLFAPWANPWPAGTTATGSSLALTLPADGSWAEFVVAGKFTRPSTRDKDAVIEVREDRPDGIVLGRKALMVRVRKNAESISTEERNRLLRAFATMNLEMENYQTFQDIHSVAYDQGHGGHGFLPWHRTVLLRIERELQAIDPAVTLPYWKFDAAAPNLFHADFLGDTPGGGAYVTLSLTNPIFPWETRFVTGDPAVAGIERSPVFPGATGHPSLIDELTTLALGTVYADFAGMEGDPHGSAHVDAGGGGYLGSVPTAARDPLFWLLHTNVDRLWAKWQLANARFDGTTVDAYTLQGTSGGSCADKGHYSLDTMWPWNGAMSPSDPCRPSTAPGGAFPLARPGMFVPLAQPRPGDLIEYRSVPINVGGAGFAYDDVPFN